jgi:sugar lactone lactonase YvrE
MRVSDNLVRDALPLIQTTMKRFFAHLILPCALSLLAACSPGTHLLKGPGKLVLFPPPPDTARVQFLTSFSASTDIEEKQGALSAFLLGNKEVVPIGKPYGIAIHHGRIYITDSQIAGFHVVDLRAGTFTPVIPDGRGTLKRPINCVVDSAGYLYIADAERRQIVVFDSLLQFVRSIGDGKDMKPTDVCLGDGILFVTDLENHRVNAYGLGNFALQYSIPNESTAEAGKLYSPVNLAYRNHRLFVSDVGAANVQEYQSNGEHIRTYGTLGTAVGQQVRPKGIAVDREHRLYVVDAAFENVQIFDDEGRILMFFGGNYKGPGDMWLPAKVMLDYDNLSYFEHLVDPALRLRYLVFVTNQFGPDKIGVYGFVEQK